MDDPYRSSGFVVPATGAQSPAEVLRAAGAVPFKLKSEWCPKCQWFDAVVEVPICTGRRRWYWPWLWRCSLRVEHLHCHCTHCKAAWIMAPADVKME